MTTHEKNEKLLQELQKRGLYAIRVGQPNDTKYLIVSCEDPRPLDPDTSSIIDYNSN